MVELEGLLALNQPVYQDGPHHFRDLGLLGQVVRDLKLSLPLLVILKYVLGVLGAG